MEDCSSLASIIVMVINSNHVMWELMNTSEALNVGHVTLSYQGNSNPDNRGKSRGRGHRKNTRHIAFMIPLSILTYVSEEHLRVSQHPRESNTWRAKKLPIMEIITRQILNTEAVEGIVSVPVPIPMPQPMHCPLKS